MNKNVKEVPCLSFSRKHTHNTTWDQRQKESQQAHKAFLQKKGIADTASRTQRTGEDNHSQDKVQDEKTS
jgi:hypothetical protein